MGGGVGLGLGWIGDSELDDYILQACVVAFAAHQLCF